VLVLRGGGGGAVEVDEVVGAGAVEVPADEALELDEAVDAAGDGEGALVPEAVLALGLLQQRAEERVLEVAQRHREPALLLPLQAHAHRHAPLGRCCRRRRRCRCRHVLLVLSGHDKGSSRSVSLAWLVACSVARRTRGRDGLSLIRGWWWLEAGREGPRVGAGDGEAEDGEGGVA
jgi:hypothetical protein